MRDKIAKLIDDGVRGNYSSEEIADQIVSLTDWQPIETAPIWTEVIVKYSGSRITKSQPECVATSVKMEDGSWSLGSKPISRKPTHWKPLPEAPNE